MLPLARPEIFRPAVGVWDRQGSTLTLLARADADDVAQAIRMAWANLSP